MKTSKIEKSVEKILRGGTRIVGFSYNGKPRNCLIGASSVDDYPSWGERLNYAIRAHNGKRFLVGIDQNDGRTPKTFEISKIRKFPKI